MRAQSVFAFLAGFAALCADVSAQTQVLASSVQCHTIGHKNGNGATGTLAAHTDATGIAHRPSVKKTVTATAPASTSTIVKLITVTDSTRAQDGARTVTSTVIVSQVPTVTVTGPTSTSTPYAVQTFTETNYTTVTSYTVNPPAPTLQNGVSKRSQPEQGQHARAGSSKNVVWCQPRLKIISTTESGPTKTTTVSATVTPRKVVTKTLTAHVTTTTGLKAAASTTTVTSTITGEPLTTTFVPTTTVAASTVSTTTTLSATVTRSLNKLCKPPFIGFTSYERIIVDTARQATAYYSTVYDDVGCCSHVASMPGALFWSETTNEPGYVTSCSGLFLDPEADNISTTSLNPDPAAALAEACNASNNGTQINLAQIDSGTYYGASQYGAPLQCGSKVNLIPDPCVASGTCNGYPYPYTYGTGGDSNDGY